jgi:hypothetical protein
MEIESRKTKEEKMKYIDARYDTIRVPGVIKALQAMGDEDTIVEDEHGNTIKAIKLFEETLTDGSKKARLQIYFDTDGNVADICLCGASIVNGRCSVKGCVVWGKS